MAINEILHTPSDIFTAVREHFPCASCQVVSHNPIVLNITLTESLSIRIDKAIQKIPFIMSLLAIKMKSHEALDGNRFSTPNDLSHLIEFGKMQRQIYELNGLKCIDLIIKYLNDPVPSSQLMSELMTLGLTPEILTNELALTLFEEISKNFPQLLPNLRAKYPAQFNFLIQESCKQDLSKKSCSNHFEEFFAKLQTSVLGQDMAVRRVASALAEDKQVGGNYRAFLFVGPTGVGKTELATAVGGIKGKFIVFYMNQYPNEHDTSRFFGAPTGYLGSDSKSDLANALDACPDKTVSSNGESIEIRNVVILFDELEKSHPTMRQSLLTLLEKGEVTISYTKRKDHSSKNVKICYKLTNSIAIGTSNLFQKEILLSFQMGRSEHEIVDLFVKLNRSAGSGNGYSPELLGRVKTIPFGPIPQEIFKQILKSKVNDFFQELKKLVNFREIVIEDEPSLFEQITNRLYGDGTDMRKIKKYFDDVKSLINSLTSQYGDVTDKKIIFYTQENRLAFKLHRYCYGDYVDLSQWLPPVLIE